MCEVCSKAPLTHCNAISRSPPASLSFDIAFLFVLFLFFFLIHLNLTLVSFFSFYHSDIIGVIITCFLPHSFTIALSYSSFKLFCALSRSAQMTNTSGSISFKSISDQFLPAPDVSSCPFQLVLRGRSFLLPPPKFT